MATCCCILQLLVQIDQGAALTIDAIPDQSLRTQLANLFDNLRLNRTRQVKHKHLRKFARHLPQTKPQQYALNLAQAHAEHPALQSARARCSDHSQRQQLSSVLHQGVYTKPKSVESLIGFLQPIFDEAPAELATQGMLTDCSLHVLPYRLYVSLYFEYCQHRTYGR